MALKTRTQLHPVSTVYGFELSRAPQGVDVESARLDSDISL